MAEERDALSAALLALEIGVFERGADGGFSSVGSAPDWLAAFSQNASFPFLGSFLEEAGEFWKEPRPTRLTWGPCAASNADGSEFHFSVSALSLPGRQLLVFELDPNAAMVREILQKAREQALDHATAENTPPSMADGTTNLGPPREPPASPTLAAAAADARRCASAVHDLAMRVRDAAPGVIGAEHLNQLAESSGLLLALIERLVAARSR